MQIPTLKTDRLILRPPSLLDVDAYAEVLASDRSTFIGGPFSGEEAWLDFCAGVAGWHLRGFGTWSLTLSDQPDFLGLVFLHREYGDPENELGWVLTQAAEGHGYAFESSVAARDFAYSTLGWTTVVSYVDPANARSRRTAERLGAQIDAEAELPAGDDPCLVYRHPAPEMLQ